MVEEYILTSYKCVKFIKYEVAPLGTTTAMSNYRIDLLKLNRDILFNPTTASGNQLVRLLELETQNLEFLCPLARAIYLIETDREDHIEVNEALGSLWLVDDNQALGTGEFGDNYADVSEVVNHTVHTTYDGVEIRLSFNSSTTMVYYEKFWPKFCRNVSAQVIGPHTSPDQPSLIDQWFAELDEETKWIHRSPNGYPTDSGQFIGTCRYTLSAINEIAVEGPSFYDSYHEQDWDGLSEDYPQRWNGEEESSCFCWLHYLSREQAEQIGIAAKENKLLEYEGDYPEWVSKKCIADLDNYWIGSDCIQENYRNGDVEFERSNECWLAIGCGTNWDASDPESQIDPENADLQEYPANAAPLLRIEINRSNESLPSEFKVLLPYIEKLLLMPR